MSLILDGNAGETFPDGTVQSTSAIVGGKVPYTNLPAGSVLQVVQGSLAGTFTTNSTSFVTTGLTASITPKYATSKILAIVSCNQSLAANTGKVAYYTLYRNSTNLAPTGSGLNQSFGNLYCANSNLFANMNFSYLDSPATTSATTYTVYAGVDSGGNANINQNNSTSYIQLLEIAQ
jgi:hypothetical protein